MANATTSVHTSTSSGLRQLASLLGLTARPDTFGERFRNSAAVWLALMVYWTLASVMLAVFPSTGRPFPPLGALIHLGVTLAGLAAIWCMHRCSFPAAWDERIPAQRRLLLPLLIGAVFGFLSIGIELYSGSLRTLQELTGTPVTISFPQSLVAYTAFSAFLELQYLVLPVALLLWLVVRVILRGRGETPVFWALAVLASAYEPATQGPSVVAAATAAGASLSVLGIALYAIHGFSLNFSMAVMLRRYGLLAAILVRVGDYLIWHILFGHLYLDRLI